MTSYPLSQRDRELIEAAREIIARRFRQDWHTVGAALRTKAGNVFSAVHLDANVGRIAVCAEAVALGMAASAGDTDIETVVAVGPNGRIVSPCGMCRELLSDYSPDCKVIVQADEEPAVVPMSELLPMKYKKKWGPNPMEGLSDDK